MRRIEVDSNKLMYHPERVAEWKEKGDCYPLYVEIGPTNQCNHECIFCALDWLNEGNQKIDKNVLSDALRNMVKWEINKNGEKINQGIKSVMFAGEGEPLLHRDIGFFVQEAKKYGMDVSMTTNGSVFNRKKREVCLPNLSWIRFSVDSGSSENYSQIHKTNPRNFEKVIENITESVKFRNEYKLETIIGIQFLMLPENIKEAVKLTKIAKEIGVDNIQIKPYSHHPGSNNNFVVNPKEYNKLEKELKEFDSDNFEVKFRKTTIERLEEGPNYSQCYGLPFFALIDSKGNVIPCNLFYGQKEFAYGNLYEQSFDKIWKGPQRKEVIEKINKKRIVDCRKGCRLDSSNRYLNRIKNPQSHDNFI